MHNLTSNENDFSFLDLVGFSFRGKILLPVNSDDDDDEMPAFVPHYWLFSFMWKSQVRPRLATQWQVTQSPACALAGTTSKSDQGGEEFKIRAARHIKSRKPLLPFACPGFLAHCW